VDLSGVSGAALLEIVVGGVARGATRVKTALQISLSGARLMTCSRSGTAELTLISSEISRVLNRKRSLRRISRLFGEGRYHERLLERPGGPVSLLTFRRDCRGC